ncbi:MAG: MBL fold metallo-hydrolase [Rubrivivax sp.]
MNDILNKPHYVDGAFQNNYLHFEPKGLMKLLRWRWEAARDGKPAPPATPTPTVPPDMAFIRSNAAAVAAMQPAVTWIGHATVLAQLGGINLLTDPVFSPRASPFSFIGPLRAQAPGVALADLPHIDVVVISHNHYDHCDVDSLKRLAAQPGGPPRFIVPLGLKAWMAGIGIEGPAVVELDWWQSHTVAGVEFVLTPVQHWSGRGLLDRMETLWGGYAVFAPDLHLFFAGDTGYSRDFADIRTRFAERQSDVRGGGFDIALIPVGAYEPRWFMSEQHVNPEEAVRIHQDLHAKQSLGVHWGTFELTDESLDDPPQALATARARMKVDDRDFFLMAVGQTRMLARRGGSKPADSGGTQ